MWVQAPWGMTWDGKEFIGEPVKLDWRTATSLFGRGISVPALTSNLYTKKMDNSDFLSGYSKGTCTVSFAGKTDWRLPTAKEIDAIGFYDEDLGYGSKLNFGTAEKSDELRERFFPNLQKLTGNWLWSANNQGGDIAWSIDGNWGPGDNKIHVEGLYHVSETVLRKQVKASR
jgi:hypothetical protein